MHHTHGGLCASTWYTMYFSPARGALLRAAESETKMSETQIRGVALLSRSHYLLLDRKVIYSTLPTLRNREMEIETLIFAPISQW